jgi:hypothetical protein
MKHALVLHTSKRVCPSIRWCSAKTGNWNSTAAVALLVSCIAIAARAWSARRLPGSSIPSLVPSSIATLSLREVWAAWTLVHRSICFVMALVTRSRLVVSNRWHPKCRLPPQPNPPIELVSGPFRPSVYDSAIKCQPGIGWRHARLLSRILSTASTTQLFSSIDKEDESLGGCGHFDCG